MPSKCFVPGCRTGYLTKIKENERAGIRNPSIFSAPKDDELFKIWRRLIPRKDKMFTSKDKICELHFEKGCIEKEYVALLSDGIVHKIPRGQIALKKGSIPTIFPNLPAYLSSKVKQRKGSTPRAGSYGKRNRKFDDLENIDIPAQLNESATTDIPSDLNENTELDTPSDIDENIESAVIETPSRLNENAKSSVTDSPPQYHDFFKFSIEVKNALPPCSWWSITCTEDCVIFAKWNSSYYPERRFVVCKDFSTKIFLMDVEVLLPIERCTVNNVSQMLKKVDDMIICKNAGSKLSSGCLGFLDGNRRKFCSSCGKFEKRERDAERKRKSRVLVSERSKLLNQVKNIEERNTYLKTETSEFLKEMTESFYVFE